VASLEFDKAANTFLVRFRFNGRSYKRSLRTGNNREARAVLGRIEETILLIERGRLEMPVNADPAAFILSDGKRIGERRSGGALSLKQLFEVYEAELPPGSKEESTLQGERIHFKTLLRHLRGSIVAQSLSAADVQGFVLKRAKDKWRGKFICPVTIKKELTTLKLVWNWAVQQDYLVGPSPVRGIKYGKPDEKPIFRTRAEIETILDRGGVSADEESAFWESLYLAREEVKELLEYVKAHARHAFIYPLFVLVAHTGARRSETLRARIDDFDFRSKTVQIREKKKSRQLAMTYRRVDLTDLLAATMKGWFDDHPGGQFAITTDGDGPISIHEAHDHFKRTLAKSKWAKLRGFHVLRHSFCSNLCAVGVDQRVIDGFVGHTTEAMRKRYQHLAPAVTRSAIERLCL